MLSKKTSKSGKNITGNNDTSISTTKTEIPDINNENATVEFTPLTVNFTKLDD